MYSMDRKVLGQTHGVRLWRPGAHTVPVWSLVLHATRMIDLPLTSSHRRTPVVSDPEKPTSL